MLLRIQALAVMMILSFMAAPIQAGELVVKDPYVRATPPGQKVTGGFMHLVNDSNKTVSIVDAHSDVAKKVELHKTQMEDGMMRMRRVKEIVIKPGETVALQPGGLHVMFMGLKQGLKPGDQVAIELQLNDGARLQVDAPVRRVMARMKKGM